MVPIATKMRKNTPGVVLEDTEVEAGVVIVVGEVVDEIMDEDPEVILPEAIEIDVGIMIVLMIAAVDTMAYPIHQRDVRDVLKTNIVKDWDQTSVAWKRNAGDEMEVMQWQE